MKTGIHPQVHQKAKTTCSSCNSVFEISSVVEDQKVEVCRLCHPIYTGKRQKEQKGGRVDRFRKRMAASKKMDQ